jgi:toxin ParE1/3/4
MLFKVVITESAENDIEAIYRYIASTDSPEKAERILTAHHETCQSLDEFPERGNPTKELRDLTSAQFREAHFKPYRVVYQILDRTVFVLAVLDGRRDMQTLLRQRLTR